MPIYVFLKDRHNHIADVFQNALSVSPIGAPVPSTETGVLLKTLPIVADIRVNGNGDFNLNVDGSVTPVDAFVEAVDDGDLYFKVANILIQSSSSDIRLDEFGDITNGLANGIETFVEEDGIRHPITNQPLQTNFDMIRIGTLSPPVGVDGTAFRIKLSGGGNADSAYNPVWDLSKLAPSDLGIRLAAKTKQKLGITIRDDLQSLLAFNIVLVGFKRLV